MLSQRWPRDTPYISSPEKFCESLATPTATFPETVNGLLLPWIVLKCHRRTSHGVRGLQPSWLGQNHYFFRQKLIFSGRSQQPKMKTRCRAIAGSNARCGCKFRYISKFSAALGGFHSHNNAFELNNSINYGKIRVFNIIYLLPLNSLFNSHCLPPFKMQKLYILL